MPTPPVRWSHDSAAAQMLLAIAFALLLVILPLAYTVTVHYYTPWAARRRAVAVAEAATKADMAEKRANRWFVAMRYNDLVRIAHNGLPPDGDEAARFPAYAFHKEMDLDVTSALLGGRACFMKDSILSRDIAGRLFYVTVPYKVGTPLFVCAWKTQYTDPTWNISVGDTYYYPNHWYPDQKSARFLQQLRVVTDADAPHAAAVAPAPAV